VLLGQSHSPEDDRNHLRALAPAFADPRYVRLGGHPTFLVYRTELLPDPARTADVWRDEAHRLGIGDICLGRVESFLSGVVPQDVGFDFAVEFAPRWQALPPRTFGRGLRGALRRSGLVRDGYTRNTVRSYREMMLSMLAWPEQAYPLFRSACPSWDNTPRRRSNATVFDGATPVLFQSWVETLLSRRRTFRGAPAPVFLNAWNEWAEGAQLEPCSVFGHGFLEAVRAAVSTSEQGSL
jgi:hypothetical protein